MSDEMSLVSGGSAHSRLSQKSMERKMEAAAEIAELKAKLRFTDIELAKRVELEKIETEKRLAMAEAKMTVFEKYDKEHFDDTTYRYGDNYILPDHADAYEQNMNVQPEVKKTELIENFIKSLPDNVNQSGAMENAPVKPLISETPAVKHASSGAHTFIHPSDEIGMECPVNLASNRLDAMAEEFTPRISKHIQIDNDITSMIAKTFADQMMLSRLPIPEPGVFAGDPLTFPSWKSAFEILIESRDIPPAERLYYLKRYVGGPVREALEGYFLLSTQDAYEEAKRLLEDRYGNHFAVAKAFRDKLDSWPKISSRNGVALRKYGDFLKQCLTATKTVETLNVLNYEKENRNMVSKLPDFLIQRWSRIVIRKKSQNRFPKFEEFVEFIVNEGNVACDSETVTGSFHTFHHASTGIRSLNHGHRTRETSFAPRERKQTHSLSTEVKKKPCFQCDKDHELDNCDIFKSKSMIDKREFVKRKGLCFGCLRWGHLSKDCPSRRTCNICSKRHPTVFHGDHGETRGDTKQMRSDSSKPYVPSVNGKVSISHLNESNENRKYAMIVPVWLSHESNSESEILVYALLDTQSDTTFILKDTCDKLGVSGCKVQLLLSTMQAENQTIESEKIKGLSVRGYENSVRIPLPTTYTRDIMPANRDHIPTPESVSYWPHLKAVSEKLTSLKNCEIGILIGYNCPRALAPRDVVPACGNEPYAVKTDLGWSVVGEMESDLMDDMDPIGTSHRILTYNVPSELSSPNTDPQNGEGPDEKKQVVFSLQKSLKESVLPSDIVKLLENDFVEQKCNEVVMSYDDKKFLDIMKREIHQIDNKHYEMPLPFRHPDPKLPNNRIQANRRLSHLVNRFRKDQKFHSDYVKFMNSMIENGHAERAPEILDSTDETIWYIPHHGVYNPKKPSKIRVVFDCSAQFRGQSLNDHLLQGPDLTNSMIGVLLRFRQERIALCCDIEQMFFQFQVDEKHRDYLRFLWFENGDYSTEPIEYRMKVHLFGATSSPGCANYALHQCADDFESEIGQSAANFVRNDFYVDDGLKSVPSSQEALDLIESSVNLCAKGGIRLHKFVCNSKNVLDSLPVEDCARNSRELSLLEDATSVERPLGIQWCIENDTLSVRVTLQDTPLTRRGILSTVCSVYDPLGFIAPVVMVGKVILQEMCRDGAEWDEPIPENLRSRWEKWRREMVELEDVRVDRCYKPEQFGSVRVVEIHHFSDASNTGYGQCSYLRLVDDQERVHVSFLMGKSRVAPIKQVTIPRLELTAAVVSVRISSLLTRELEFEDIREVFWTDSKVVIGYVNNDSKRFHVFVANRVAQIREKSDPSQWKYVESEKNPADDASRGLTPRNLIHKSEWLQGPSFLWNKSIPDETRDVVSSTLFPDDPELKRTKSLAMKTECVKPEFELERLEHCSNWYKLKRIIAMCLKLKTKLKYSSSENDAGKSNHERQIKCDSLTVDDIHQAELEIIRQVQQKEFREEMKTLKMLKRDETVSANLDRTLKRSSRLSSLDPFLDDDDIIRVGGRVRKSCATCNIKHPAILPKGSHVSKLIVSYFHDRTQHQGRGITLNEIRSNGFWIIGSSSVVSSHIFHCVMCRKLRSQVQQQKMADLPPERVNDSPPFSYCGVDCFGPFLVKEGRKSIKRYGVLFTCLACRAIHIEVATSLSADSFINTVRQFQAIRGPIRELRCDRGTNFVGAPRELKEALTDMDVDKLRDTLVKENCDFIEFKFNVPAASHMGGIWERQIRTVRSVLAALMTQATNQLDDDSLRTVMCEAMTIVNSRPLSVENLNDPLSFEPLTANHLLTMKTSVLLPPPGRFQKTDVYSCKQWKRVQYYANEFWSRWKKEVLHNLQSRQKWVRPRRNCLVGDIMIVTSDNLPRNQWQIGRIVEVFPSSDEHIRKVKLQMADPHLDPKGRRVNPVTYLERPIQKLILLLESQNE